MIELYKLGYLVKENNSEALAAKKATPPSFEKLVDMKQRKIMRKIEQLEADLASSERARDLGLSRQGSRTSCESESLIDIDSDMVIKLKL